MINSFASNSSTGFASRVGRILLLTAAGFLGMSTAARAADLEIVVVHAEDDDVVPPAHARCLTERLPSAQLVLLPSGGHLPTSWTDRGLIA